MVHPFIALLVDVLLGAERALVEHHLGALIDHRTDVARERHAVLLALEEILPHLGADFLEQKADMRRDRVVAQPGCGLCRPAGKPSPERPPNSRIGISRKSNHSGSKMTSATRSAVTTVQIVSTMKRGENGSSSVSM